MIKRSTALQSLITRGTPLTDQNGKCFISFSQRFSIRNECVQLQMSLIIVTTFFSSLYSSRTRQCTRFIVIAHIHAETGTMWTEWQSYHELM